MIVLFGASSDIGRLAARRLLDEGFQLRLVARDPSDLDERAERVAGDISAAGKIAVGAKIVVSCAHARFTDQLLAGLPQDVRQLVLVGSAWRYSRLPNPIAEQIREAEAIFLGSSRCGVMLHPTMIYGGFHDNNLRRLLKVIRQWPILPVPGGGFHLVQPIYVEDVAASIAAAVRRSWTAPTVIPIAGPEAMRWRDMALICMRQLGHRPRMLSVPPSLAIGVVSLMRAAGLPAPLDPDIIRRFREDIILPLAAMLSELAVAPREFSVGLRLTLEDWAKNGDFRAHSI